MYGFRAGDEVRIELHPSVRDDMITGDYVTATYRAVEPGGILVDLPNGDLCFYPWASVVRVIHPEQPKKLRETVAPVGIPK